LLRKIILGLLTIKPASGYDLKAKLDQFEDIFGPAQQSQIYRELNHLKQQGAVMYQTEHNEGRPDKKLYYITEIGNELFIKWLKRDLESRAQKFRDELDIKMFFGHQLNRSEIVSQLNLFIEAGSKELSTYEKAKKENSICERDDVLYQGLILERKCLTIQAQIDWAKKSISKIICNNECFEVSHNNEEYS